jgi:sugar lactone lactonase YvrE
VAFVRGGAALLLVAVTAAGGPAHAVRDHQHCYRIADPLALSGIVDVSGPFGLEPGCRLGKAKLFCDPADATVVVANVPVGAVTGRGLLDGRLCYRLHCPPPHPADQRVTDPFGTRSLRALKPRLLCTPAVSGPPAPTMDNLDHLLCYKARDPLALRALVDVATLDLGTLAGCTVTRGKLLCVPASTTVQRLNVSPELPIAGTGADDARVCYGVRCPRPHPGPTLVSDRFGSRTVGNPKPRLLCAPAPTTTTVTTTTTSTSTTSLPPSDPPLACQVAIEAGGMAYARATLDAIAACTAPGGSASLGSCMAGAPVAGALAAVRADWAADTAGPCSGVDLRATLGYAETCGAPPSACTFASPLRDAPGGGNDVLDCLACRIEEQLRTSALAMYAGQDAVEPCRDAVGNGSLAVLRGTLDAAYACVQQPTATSVAACWTPSFAAWRAQAVAQCAGIDPFTTLGYPPFCSGYPPAAPNSYAPHAYPCSINASTLDNPAVDNDLLDCVSCQANEGALGVARDLFGAHPCCIGGACGTVRTRYACRRDGGTPARYRISTLAASDAGQAHGIATGPDGSLYIGHITSATVRRVTPAGAVSTVANTAGFVRGVAVDAAGNVYTADGCAHTITRHVPGGGSTVIAGLPGLAGSTGDGGPAAAARLVMPDGVDVDAAGNVYFTESGLLGFLCGTGVVTSERVRMIDTSGIIHTVAGGGSGPEGGPAVGALLSMPYGLRLGLDGSLYVGEAIGMRVLRVSGGTLTRTAGVLLSLVGSHSGFGGPAASARFYENCGVAVDPDGNVIVGMMEDNRIALVDAGGSVIAIAGTGEGPGGAPGLGDGAPAILDRIQTPEDVAVAPDGTIYVSELGTGRIRILTREPF